LIAHKAKLGGGDFGNWKLTVTINARQISNAKDLYRS
jgi:hypothetical protein